MKRTPRVPAAPRSLLGLVALSGSATFLLLAADPIGAGPGAPPRHGARAGEVTVDGTLTREGTAWAIRLQAANAGAGTQGCQVTASLARTRVNPMARALPRAEEVWSTAVALRVPAGGGTGLTLRIPTEIAAQIREPREAGEPPTLEVSESFDVQIRALCAAPDGSGLG